jgi:hypothetical protein
MIDLWLSQVGWILTSASGFDGRAGCRHPGNARSHSGAPAGWAAIAAFSSVTGWPAVGGRHIFATAILIVLGGGSWDGLGCGLMGIG